MIKRGEEVDGRLSVFQSGSSAGGAVVCMEREAGFAGKKVELEIAVEKGWRWKDGRNARPNCKHGKSGNGVTSTSRRVRRRSGNGCRV